MLMVGFAVGARVGVGMGGEGEKEREKLIPPTSLLPKEPRPSKDPLPTSSVRIQMPIFALLMQTRSISSQIREWSGSSLCAFID